MPPHQRDEVDDPDHFCWDCDHELRLEYGGTDDWYYVCSHAASFKVASVRGVSVLNTPWRPAYFNSLALSKRYLSIARRMSSATGAPVFSDSFTSLLSCSSFKKRAVRFMTI